MKVDPEAKRAVTGFTDATLPRDATDEVFRAMQPMRAENIPLELTILMPCLNEAETIGSCVAQARSYLARCGLAGEVLVADNGSAAIARSLGVSRGLDEAALSAACQPGHT
jgi:hypothetical protein